MGWPGIVVKGIVAIGVLLALLILVRAFRAYDGPAFHVLLTTGSPALRS